MPSFEFLIPFFIATAIFACVPGPGLLYAAARTLANGRQAGWRAAIGLHIGGYGHIAATACGLAVLLEAVPMLYAVIKFAGAAYLIWLGYRMFRSSGAMAERAIHRAAPGNASSDAPGNAPDNAPDNAMTQSILVELLNPKTALFYLAFLPQFTDLDATFAVWLQVLVLGVIVNAMFSITDIACILLADRAMRLMSASRAANQIVRRIGGGIVIGLGINLAMSRQ